MFLSLSFIFFFSLPTFIHLHFLVNAGCLYVTDTLSTLTIIEPPSVECQDLLITCQIECMCGHNRPRFIYPSERMSNEVQVPCLGGLRNDHQKSCFLLSLPGLHVSLAPTRLPWPPRQLSEGYDSCTRCCCQGSSLGPSAPKSDALTTPLGYLPMK